jgi:acyl-CoA thioester hydrolase
VGLNFEQLCKDGIDAVVTRIEIDYKLSLKSRDEFTARLGMHKQGRVRFVFDQAIFRKSDGKLVAEAQVTGVLTRNGRPVAPILFDEVFIANGWEF